MRPVVAGNWKMHHGPSETRRYFERFTTATGGPGPLVLFFPPAVSLEAMRECLAERDGTAFGVQNIHWEEAGAFTGETSAGMASDAGAHFVLVGHSERRHVFGETNEETTRKVERALAADLIPVVCVGETLDERRSGRLESVIVEQLDAAVGPAGGRTDARLLVAYEPVWAIGTGETATPEDASRAHSVLAGRLAELLGSERAENVPILYGGSVKPANAAELMEAQGVDGVLVGGASLDPEAFQAIIRAAPGSARA